MSQNSIWAKLAKLGKPVLIVPPILVAVIVLIYVSTLENEPKERSEEEQQHELSRKLSYIQVERFDVRPKVSAFGTSRYAKTWRAVPRVSGTVVYVHPKLRSGSILGEQDSVSEDSSVRSPQSPDQNGSDPESTKQTLPLLFSIEETDFVNTRDKLQATLDQNQANLDQLDKTRENLEASLKIEKELKAVSKIELDRATDLESRGAGAKSAIDAKKRAFLTQSQRVQDFENQLALIEPQRKGYEAGIQQARAQLKQAEIDLKRTKIYAPFLPIRIGEVNLQVGQLVSTNEVLFEGYSFDRVEIEAQLDGEKIPLLVDRGKLVGITFDDISVEKLRQIFPVDIQVKNNSGGPDATWTAQIEGFREALDVKSKTIGLIVSVQNEIEPVPTESIGDLQKLFENRRPLIQGAFCEVTFFGKPQSDQLVVPQNAIRNFSVCVINGEGKLKRRRVSVAYEQDGYSVIANGLQPGEKLVVSDPRPVIDGMLVKGFEDQSAAEELRQLVSLSSSFKASSLKARQSDKSENQPVEKD